MQLNASSLFRSGSSLLQSIRPKRHQYTGLVSAERRQDDRYGESDGSSAHGCVRQGRASMAAFLTAATGSYAAQSALLRGLL
jgi:hypothetical protein